MVPDRGSVLLEKLFISAMPLRRILSNQFGPVRQLIVVRAQTCVKYTNSWARTGEFGPRSDGDPVISNFKERGFACLPDFQNILECFIRVLRGLIILIYDSNQSFCFEYRRVLSLVLSPLFIALGSSLHLLLASDSSLAFCAVILLADICTVAAVGSLLHPQSTLSVPSVISFF